MKHFIEFFYRINRLALHPVLDDNDDKDDDANPYKHIFTPERAFFSSWHVYYNAILKPLFHTYNILFLFLIWTKQQNYAIEIKVEIIVYYYIKWEI